MSFGNYIEVFNLEKKFVVKIVVFKLELVFTVSCTLLVVYYLYDSCNYFDTNFSSLFTTSRLSIICVVEI